MIVFTAFIESNLLLISLHKLKGSSACLLDVKARFPALFPDKNCQKIHPLAPNMVCCGAGTAADCDKVTNMIASQLKLLRLDWNRQVRVKTANHLFKQMLFR